MERKNIVFLELSSSCMTTIECLLSNESLTLIDFTLSHSPIGKNSLLVTHSKVTF